MLKATAKGPDGRAILVVGLSFGNLDKFRQQPGDTYIRIAGDPIDFPGDVVIFSGETEAHLADFMAQFIGPDTNVSVSPRLKS